MVLSPLTLYRVLRGDEKQENRRKKSSCTNNENKAKVCLHLFSHTATNRAVARRARRVWAWSKRLVRGQPGVVCVAESLPDKPQEPRSEGGRAPQEKGFQDPESRRDPVGPEGASGSREINARPLQMLKTSVPPSPLPSAISLSVK